MKRCNAVEKVKGLDKFGQSFQFGFGPSGETKVKSLCGAMLSILVSIVMLVYAGYRFNFLLEKEGATIVQTIKEQHYTADDEFAAAQGFMFVAAFGQNVPREVGELVIY